MVVLIYVVNFVLDLLSYYIVLQIIQFCACEMKKSDCWSVRYWEGPYCGGFVDWVYEKCHCLMLLGLFTYSLYYKLNPWTSNSLHKDNSSFILTFVTAQKLTSFWRGNVEIWKKLLGNFRCQEINLRFFENKWENGWFWW